MNESRYNILHYLALNIAKGLSLKEKISIAASSKLFNDFRANIDNNFLQSNKDIKKAFSWLAANKNNHIVCYNQKAYPQQLKEITSPPILLFCQGDTELLNTQQFAIVGSRGASKYGCIIANEFSRSLATIGITITSGLAAGIDSAAAIGTMAISGKTIAVLGTGIDISYPSKNNLIQKQISEQGLLVSEFLLGTPPKKHNFPQRNRIISGMSVGTCVVEAALASGSLITARYALEQNKEVFAVPGPIYEENYAGTNKLIQEGAKLTSHCNDIIFELQQPLSTVNKYQENKNYYVLKIITEDEQDIDNIIKQANIARPEVLSALLNLESERLISYGKYGYKRANTSLIIS